MTLTTFPFVDGVTDYVDTARVTAADSTYTEVFASTSGAASYLYIGAEWLSTNQTREMLIRVATGADTAETDIVTDILVGVKTNRRFHSFSYVYPVNIPSGTRVSVYLHLYNGGSATNGDIVVTLFNGTPEIASPTMVTIGKVTDKDPGGTANTKSGWTSINGAISNDVHGLILSGYIGAAASNNSAAWSVDVAYGSSQSNIVIQNYVFRCSTNYDTLYQHVSPIIPETIPSGEPVYVRVSSTETNSLDRPLTIFVQGYKSTGIGATPLARLSQTVAEAASQQDAANVNARLTQQYAEVLLRPFSAIARMDQIVAEAASQQSAANVNARLTQQYAEILLKPGTVAPLYLTNPSQLNLAAGIVT